jgi:hypothetical protein
MLEDFRNHDPKPTQQESAWMQADPFRVLARVAALALLALAIGTTASEISNGSQPHPVVAKAP